MTRSSPETPPQAGIDPHLWQAFSLRWSALHDAAAAVAALAGLAPDRPDMAIRGFPARVRAVAPRRFLVIDQGLADIAAIMQPGLAALLAVNARGQDATAPARALWQEFQAARAALVALVPADGAPRRPA